MAPEKSYGKTNNYAKKMIKYSIYLEKRSFPMFDWLFDEITDMDISDTGEALSLGIFDDENEVCPECGTTMENDICPKCGFTYEP